jgi:hypothetical protein
MNKNNRLDKFLVENNIIHENQIGFSKKSRTSDHINVPLRPDLRINARCKNCIE